MRSADVIHTVRSKIPESSQFRDLRPNSQDGEKTSCFELLSTLVRTQYVFNFFSSHGHAHCEIPENDVDSLDDVDD